MRGLALLLVLLLPSLSCAADWRTASRESAGIAPKPEAHADAVVHVYAARAIRWRGWFAVHSWVAVKEKGAPQYTTFHVTRFGLRRGLPAVTIKEDVPDRHWFGARPTLIAELIGPAAEAAIPTIRRAAEDYPYPRRYRVWPGPNSNTFVSYILRRVPELRVELPPHAIGRDWLADSWLFSKTETGTGVQASLYGLLSLSVGAGEGVEASVLGLTFGVDILRPALKLPLVGRVGLSDRPAPKLGT